ncbi:MAG: hypothetical protein GKS02_12435 [Alphaproteobacteria bacterium]|nr:hypothetical protein [Alphaproteobacteria bacterium]
MSPEMRQCIVVAIWVQNGAGDRPRLGVWFASRRCSVRRRGSDWSQFLIAMVWAAFADFCVERYRLSAHLSILWCDMIQ